METILPDTTSMYCSSFQWLLITDELVTLGKGSSRLTARDRQLQMTGTGQQKWSNPQFLNLLVSRRTVHLQTCDLFLKLKTRRIGRIWLLLLIMRTL